ncbi:hypothetical protein CSA17_07465 [bacterium DOLJORAL78_65_58]|nr:MAG: hypothetical protein CSB20_02395 [bacterium DOLZORAL124_64_63]PIE75443.1 MAG: hypothetical protein CSA17_07465 [bacterium DOLJORAL78_65_58]
MDIPRKKGDKRDALELAQTAKARFETTEAATRRHGLDLDRVKALGDGMLDRVHRGPQQENVLWVLETAIAMLTAVMAVNQEPLPVARQVDPAVYAMSVLRDLAVDAEARGIPWPALEEAAADLLRNADETGHTNGEAYWALNRATAQLELAWARDLAGPPDASG